MGITPQSGSLAGTSSSFDSDALTIPWSGCVPLGSYIEISKHVVLLAPATEANPRHHRKAYWRNENEEWVKFIFTIKESELVFFDETPKGPRMVCQSHPGRIDGGVSAAAIILAERLTCISDSHAATNVPKSPAAFSVNLMARLKKSTNSARTCGSSRHHHARLQTNDAPSLSTAKWASRNAANPS